MIELKNISAGYGKKPVLKNVSLSFPKNRLISVVGTNGSGKSTLLKTIIGILPPVSGEIFADNVKVSTLRQQDIAKKIAYLAQGKDIPDMTVEQMVLHGRFPHLSYPRRYTDKDREIAWSAMKQMGLSDYAGNSLSSLSGGMRQNAYIAMVLSQDTDYILMDEPTTYLDISHQLELMRMLRNLANSGKGIVIVMHDLPLAFTFSDDIVVIKDGSIAMCGSPQSVCSSGIMKETFGIEFCYSASNESYCYKY